jgi:hypothetical protein
MKTYKRATDAVKALKMTKTDLEILGVALRNSIMDRIGNINGRNSEIKGKPLSEKYLNGKNTGGKIRYKIPSRKNLFMYNTGSMYRATAYEIKGKKILIGYGGEFAKIARRHNQGLAKMPKREFLFFDEKHEEKIINDFILNLPDKK